MTLDKAIEEFEEGAKFTWNGKPTANAEECQQMVEWLKDYKRLQMAIDDIKAEIKSKKFSGYANDNGSADLPDYQAHFNSGLILALEIIERHTSGGTE